MKTLSKEWPNITCRYLSNTWVRNEKAVMISLMRQQNEPPLSLEQARAQVQRIKRGGLSLGFEAAGYKTLGYEMEPNAVETYRQILLEIVQIQNLILLLNTLKHKIIIGGPPCQPFSMERNQQGIERFKK